MIDVSPLQRVKASFPILATLFGIEIYLIFEQLRNDELRIVVDPSEIKIVSILEVVPKLSLKLICPGIATYLSPLQSEKVPYSILVTLLGIEIYFIFEQFLNDELRIVVDPSEITTVSILEVVPKLSLKLICPGIATYRSPLQPKKASPPIYVTLLGILIDVSPLQLEKALPPILVTLLGISIEVSPLQPEKALCPIIVTLFGIVIDVSPLQSTKAPYPILVTL